MDQRHCQTWSSASALHASPAALLVPAERWMKAPVPGVLAGAALAESVAVLA